MTAMLPFIIAILATYRLAHLLPEDDGPFFIFKRVRFYTSNMAVNDNDEWGFWQMIDDGIHCVYCCGLYAAIVCGLLAAWNNYYGNVFLLIFAIAGGQSLLQRLSDK
jgi:hypothetical protein